MPWVDEARLDDPDALRAKALTEVPLLEGATHCFVSATITHLTFDPDYPTAFTSEFSRTVEVK